MNKEIMNAIDPSFVLEVENGNCPFCHQQIDKTKFKDELSVKEFGISGMCQVCQDKIFNN